jgi:hypothetical protein
MNLNIKDWKEFKISKLFTLETGKANQGMLEEGDECFYVGAKRDNNGVMIHCAYNKSLIQKGNCIIFICNGQGSVGYANYMDVDFIGTTDIVAGYNEKLNSYNGVFIATILCQERPKYSFGRKWKTHLNDTIINLPIKHNADKTPFIDEMHEYSEDGYVPDWDFMEDYIKSLHSKPLTTKNKNKKIPALNVDKWKEFSLDKLFEIKKGKRLTSEDQEDGDYNYIGAIDSNNGVANHIAQKPIHEANTITLSYNGSVGEAFYQDEPYWATDDVNALYPRCKEFNKSIGLFICAVIRQEKYRFSYGRKWTLENMKITKIKLPARQVKKGQYVPDWEFMENYIKALPYGDRI